MQAKKTKKSINRSPIYSAINKQITKSISSILLPSVKPAPFSGQLTAASGFNPNETSLAKDIQALVERTTIPGAYFPLRSEDETENLFNQEIVPVSLKKKDSMNEGQYETLQEIRNAVTGEIKAFIKIRNNLPEKTSLNRLFLLDGRRFYKEDYGIKYGKDIYSTEKLQEYYNNKLSGTYDHEYRYEYIAYYNTVKSFIDSNLPSNTQITVRFISPIEETQPGSDSTVKTIEEIMKEVELTGEATVEKGGIRYDYRSIAPEHLQSLELFIEEINKLMASPTKEQGGSGVRAGSFLDPNFVTFSHIKIIGNGERSKPLFAKMTPFTCTLAGKDKGCLFNSVFSQIKYDRKRPIDYYIKSVDQFEKELIEKYNTSIELYLDCLVHDTFAKSKPFPIGKKQEATIGKKKVEIWLYEVEPKIKLAKPATTENKVSVVYYNKHFIPYSGCVDDKIHVDSKCNVYINYKQITRAKLLKHADEKKEVKQTEIITFDLETCYGKDNRLVPYSISWSFGKPLYDVSQMNDKPIYTAFAYGKDCVDVFIEQIKLKMSTYTNAPKFCLLGYNSSRFDNSLILPYLIKHNLFSDIFYQGNSILNISWNNGCSSFDIQRFTQCALEKACNDGNYACKYRKIGGFDHIQPQIAKTKFGSVDYFFHDENCPLQNKPIFVECYVGYNTTSTDISNTYKACSCKKMKDLFTYNTYDTLTTAELFYRIETEFREAKMLETKPGDSLTNFKTVGSISWKRFVTDVKKAKILLPKLTLEQNEIIRKSAMVAGRTQCYKGAYRKICSEPSFKMVDVKSLYPFVCLANYYPVGEVLNLSYDECVEKDLIGFYHCKFNQSGLVRKIIPLREKGKSLNWDYSCEIDTYLSTVDIKCLKDYGVSVEVSDGFCFSAKIHGKDLFKCMVYFKAIKTEQDFASAIKNMKPEDKRAWLIAKNKELVSNGLADEQVDVEKMIGLKYNVARRNMAKLVLNSLTGKVGENVHDKKCMLINDKLKFDKMLKKAVSLNSIVIDEIFDRENFVVTWREDFEKCFEKGQKPVYLSSLIYSYSRDHMYRSVIADYDIIYQDTDSALLTNEEYDRFKQEKSHLIGSEFGQFELEAGSDIMSEVITIAPKHYYIYGIKDDKRVLVKKGFKGCNLAKDVFIRQQFDQSANVEKIIVAHISSKAFDYYNYKSEGTKTKAGLVANIGENLDEFVETLIDKGHVNILSSNLVKTRHARKVNGSELLSGNIYQQFNIKKINSSFTS